MIKSIALLLATSIVALPVAASTKTYEPVPLPSGATIDTAGMLVETVLEQETIATNIDIGRVAPSVGGGGLIGALIIADIDRKRRRDHETQAQQRADSAVAALRNTLSSFDVRSLADAATAAAFRSSVACGEANGLTCDSTGAAYGKVNYSYGLSPDFTQIRIAAEVELTFKGTDPIVVRHTITSVVELRQRSYEQDVNAAEWAAHDARLAKSALEAGFARFGTLIPETVSIDAERFKLLTDKKRPKLFAAGYYGPELFSDALGRVIWTPQGAVAIQQI